MTYLYGIHGQEEALAIKSIEKFEDEGDLEIAAIEEEGARADEYFSREETI